MAISARVEARQFESAYDRSGVVVIGVLTGFAACVVYAAIAASDWHDAGAATLAASFGPLLLAASWGIREFITLDRRRLAADLGAATNALAGTLFSAMALVQLAVKAKNDDPSEEFKAIWLGLDVAWDVYIALGTVLFALAALAHPRLGKPFALSGILIGGTFLSFNLGTFPRPPVDAGLVDLGPLVGLWYFAVTAAMLLSLRWARTQAQLSTEAQPNLGP